MQLSKFDIGAEIISILTKGIYPDPRDAVREYIQNAIDAKAKNVTVNVGQDYISITDNGNGMGSRTMRDAIRLGVSDKQPGKDVGFMGIGIYSSFHLCDILGIYSKTAADNPAKLTINFKQMRLILEKQRVSRSEGVNSKDLMGLQALLESCIELTNLSIEKYPKTGTIVELTGLNPIILNYLSNFDDLSKYLQDAVPLHFNPRFTYGKEIEKKVKDICLEHCTEFEVVHLTLDVLGQKKELFKPYTDSIFSNNLGQNPRYELIKHNETFIGIAWGVLNSARKVISEKGLRGFLLKKQGFAIGNREKLSKYFTTMSHFNRHTGEIIITHPNLLPNASRDGLHPSQLQKQFEIALQKITKKYSDYSNNFQEYDKREDTLKENKKILSGVIATEFEFSEDVDELIKQTTKLSSTLSSTKRISKGTLDAQGDENQKQKYLLQKEKAKNLLISINETNGDIASRLKKLVNIKKARKNNQKSTIKETENATRNKFESAQRIKDIGDSEPQIDYKSLINILEDLDVELPQIAIDILTMIDEEFLIEASKTQTDYQNILQNLKKKILLLIEGENE